MRKREAETENTHPLKCARLNGTVTPTKPKPVLSLESSAVENLPANAIKHVK